jgi:hypothetical protein
MTPALKAGVLDHEPPLSPVRMRSHRRASQLDWFQVEDTKTVHSRATAETTAESADFELKTVVRLEGIEPPALRSGDVGTRTLGTDYQLV